MTQAIQLLPGEAHVWRFPLDASKRERTQFDNWLSERERGLLRRMSSEQARNRRATAWGRLRAILGRYADSPPHAIRFTRGPSGRPELVRPDPPGLRFNLAHSGKVGLVGVSMSAVGVDIEQVRTTVDIERLADRFFTSDEATELRTTAEDQRLQSFFRLWAVKEAYVKASGMGVPAGLSCCEFSLQDDRPRVQRVPDNLHRLGLTLQEIEAPGGYVAAVAILRDDVAVSVFDLA